MFLLLKASDGCQCNCFSIKVVEALANNSASLGAVMCLSPEGRGQPECVVTVPNEFTTRIPPPGIDEFRQLEQICEHSITSKYAADAVTTFKLGIEY
jgi:hypothetical protein